jgi:hypothetical protein
MLRPVMFNNSSYVKLEPEPKSLGPSKTALFVQTYTVFGAD